MYIMVTGNDGGCISSGGDKKFSMPIYSSGNGGNHQGGGTGGGGGGGDGGGRGR